MQIHLPENIQNNAPQQLYGFGERIYRLMTLQGIVSSIFEQALVWFYEACRQFTCQPKVFDAKREARGVDSLMRLGAVHIDLHPDDGFATLEAFHLEFETLNERIETLGGAWEQLSRTDARHSMYVIVPPELPCEQWTSLQADMLRLKWPLAEVEIENQLKQVLVTCPNADNVPDEGGELFVHHSSSTPTVAMLTARIGFVLGMKRNIFLYNPRGVGKSTGIASEAGFYSDAEIVWKWLVENNYDNEKTWFSSACAGGYRTGYLFATFPEVRKSGVNWLWENGTVVSKRDWIDIQLPPMIRWIGYCISSGISCRDIPMSLRLRETGYDLEAHFASVEEKAVGRCVVVGPNQDKLFAKNHVVALSQKHFEKCNVVGFDSAIHDARFFHDPVSTDQVIVALFY